MFRTAALALAIAAVPLTAASAEALDPNAVVYCHDVNRDLVQRVRVRHCSGRIVSPGEAASIQGRIDAERQARRARVLERDRMRQAQGLQFHSAGTAFAVNPGGELLTSAHVVRGCDRLEARAGEAAARIPVRVKAHDDLDDLAILAIAATPSGTLRFAPDSPADGEPLALIGYPAEGLIRLRPRLTPVLISHAISDPARTGFIGVAGDVRHGNSGGPALDSRGRAVGVLKAKVDSVAARRLTGRALSHLGVVVKTGRVLGFLARTGTQYMIDRDPPVEMSGRDLFAHGRRAVYRIDCFKRS